VIHSIMKIIALCSALFLAAGAFAADSTAPAANAINSFGLDLLRNAAKPDTNALYSPYSIELTLAMTYAGANGVTRDEMAKTLHFGTNEMEVHHSFALLRAQLEGMMQRSGKLAVGKLQSNGIVVDPITFVTANRVFGSVAQPFRGGFRDFLRSNYQAPLLQFDFTRGPAAATKLMNDAVLGDTRSRIPDLIPEGALNIDTRVVLVNAVYLKAPWAEPFDSRGTAPVPFHIGFSAVADVPMMWKRDNFGYMKYNGFAAISIPYSGNELQFLILLPDATNGVQVLESRLTQIGACADLPVREIIVGLPKFKITLPTLSLEPILRGLGMKTAFDEPTADFSRMSGDKIFLTAAFHKTFLNLDEKGTEASAATVVRGSGTGIEPKVMVVTVDRPFIFAIQHRASGACLFLGHVVDPR
jgi:serpin B